MARSKKKLSGIYSGSMHARITSALRQIWQHCDARAEALARCKVRGIAKGHLCEWCGKITISPEVDHIQPVGVSPGSKNWTDETWDGYIARLLYVRACELQVLCKECHLEKTRQDKEQKNDRED